MAKIQHLAIVTDRRNLERLVKFYVDVFEMNVLQRRDSPKGSVAFLTDGYMNLALIASASGRTKGVDHFGFVIDEAERPMILERLAKYEIAPLELAGSPYVEAEIRDVDGNKVDLTTGGLKPQPESSPT